MFHLLLITTLSTSVKCRATITSTNSNSRKRKRECFDILEKLLNEHIEYQNYWEDIIHPPPKKQVLPPGLRDKKMSDEESKVPDKVKKKDEDFIFDFDGISSDWLIDYLENMDYWDNVINPTPTNPVLPPGLEERNKIEKLKRIYHGNNFFIK